VMTTSATGGARWGPTQAVEPSRQVCNAPLQTCDTATTGSIQPIVNRSQIMPSMTITGGKVTIIYYDFGDDVSPAFDTLQDVGSLRHTVDVRVVQASPASTPIFGPSVRISQYLTGSLPSPKSVKPVI